MYTSVFQRDAEHVNETAKEYFDRFPSVETVIVSDRPPTKNDFRYEKGMGITEGRSVYMYFNTKTRKLSRVVPVVNP